MYRVTDRQYRLDKALIINLNTIINNMRDDWNFNILITGHGKTRIGKSMFAQQVGYYVSYNLGVPFTLNNEVFSGSELISTAKRLPKNSVIIYDEAKAELDAKRAMEGIQKDLMQFFAECGKYNHLIILVLPDYFDLNSTIALNASEFLIDITRQSTPMVDQNNPLKSYMKFDRGFYDFYNDDRKRQLYIEGKMRFRRYLPRLRNFWGAFDKCWILDEVAYNAKKSEYLNKAREIGRVVGDKYRKQRDMFIKILIDECDVTGDKLEALTNKYGNPISMNQLHLIKRNYKQKEAIA